MIMADSGRWNPGTGDPSFDEVNRTDRFLDALADGLPVHTTDAGEAELADLLAGWRDEVRTPPIRIAESPSDSRSDSKSDSRVVPMRRGGPPRGRRRISMAVIGSVAAGVLFVGGFGAVVSGAGPGDALYGLRTMLFGEDQATRDDEVILAAQTQLAEAQLLIDQGDWAGAQEKLQAVTTTVATVVDDQRKQDLANQWRELAVKVESRDVNATVPPDAPPATLPELPVTTNPAVTAPEASPETTPEANLVPETTTRPVTTSAPSTTRPTTSADAPAPVTEVPETPETAVEPDPVDDAVDDAVGDEVESDAGTAETGDPATEPATDPATETGTTETGTAETDTDTAVSATPETSSPVTTTPSAPATSTATTPATSPATTAPTTSAATTAQTTGAQTTGAQTTGAQTTSAPTTSATTANPATTAPATTAPATTAPATTVPTTSAPARSAPTTTAAAPETVAPQQQQPAPAATTTVVLPLIPAGEE